MSFPPTNSQESSHTSEDSTIHVSLTPQPLNVSALYNTVKTPRAGAIVTFSGCTRATSIPEGSYIGSTHQTNGEGEGEGGGGGGHKWSYNTSPSSRTAAVADADVRNGAAGKSSSIPQPVESLTYVSYVPLALKTLRSIAEGVREKHGLEKVAIVHRLGTVPVGEESVVVCVSAGHRGEAWAGAEEALEMVKKRVEVWKWEVFTGFSSSEEEGLGVWRSNVLDGGGRPVNGEEGEWGRGTGMGVYFRMGAGIEK